MAYGLGARFPDPTPYARLLDPGAYDTLQEINLKANCAPFLSRAKRVTQPGSKVYTHAIYNVDCLPPHIPNCVAFKSKKPRFPYEALSKEELDEILCRCGINSCECPDEEEPVLDETCQGQKRRVLFIGSPSGPHIVPKVAEQESPPFYDTRVEELTAFYRGCKWSKRTSKRTTQPVEQRPGPADYTIQKPSCKSGICIEKVKEYKRKTSKQLRYIEQLHRMNIKDNRPGPATYHPSYPKGTDLRHLGPKQKRFTEAQHDIQPGPTYYYVKRDFDLPDPPLRPCLAKLPEPACFGVKAKRFKPRYEEGASPATYNVKYKPCRNQNCCLAPFLTSEKRFKDTLEDEEEDDEDELDDECKKKEENEEVCVKPTNQFKSKTIRMKPLTKQLNEPSPADLKQSKKLVKRCPYLQYIAPFYSSEGRMRPWFNELGVLGRLKTPGPGYYTAEKAKCWPAVSKGPICRSRRFPPPSFLTPAPNEYKISGGVSDVLLTKNQRLKENMEKQHKFRWEPPKEHIALSYEEMEANLLKKSIDILEPAPEDVNDNPSTDVEPSEPKQKLLRYFLYNHQFKKIY